MTAIAALAVLLSASAGAVPVDMRILPSGYAPSARAAAPPPQSDEAYFAGGEIMAGRMTLNDLIHIAEVLHNEARKFDSDASDLWTQWLAAGPGLQLSPSPAEEMRRTEAFAVMSAGRMQYSHAQRLIDRLGKADAQWWRIWRQLDAEATARRDGSAVRPQLDKFRTQLESLARESNALDAGIRQVQGQYDFARPMMLEHLMRARSMSPVLRPAWHWNYALSNRPRPDLSYDYVERHEAHYEESLGSLRAR